MTNFTLPPGNFSTWSEQEYVCDCPFCGRESKFTWNVVKHIGRCFICDRWIKGETNFLLKFSGGFKEVSLDIFNLRVKQVPDKVNRNFLCNAWEDPKAREFLIGRNVNELVSMEANIQYMKEKKCLYIGIDPIIPEYPKSYLWRQLGPTGKWFHRKGTKSNLYAWGVSKFTETKTNILVCEGIFDLLSTRLHKKGIAVLGSNLNLVWYYWFLKKANKLVLWFDNDEAGHKATKTIAQKCEYYSIPYSVILSKKDPKLYDRRIPKDNNFLLQIEDHLISEDYGEIIKD